MNPRARQSGMVLIIALIVLVAMTLAGIALVRSVDTTNVIAGNLAFRQAATHASDKGIEAAIAWLTSANTAILEGTTAATGYLSARADPAPGDSWDEFWMDSLDSQAVTLTPNPDAAGNTVKYFIHRLCQASGSPTVAATGCSFAPVACDQTSSAAIPSRCDTPAAQVYYRITSQVTGPRSTTTYVQSIIAL